MNKKKPGRPKKITDKRKAISIYLNDLEKKQLIQKYGSISFAIKNILINKNESSNN